MRRRHPKPIFWYEPASVWRPRLREEIQDLRNECSWWRVALFSAIIGFLLLLLIEWAYPAFAIDWGWSLLSVVAIAGFVALIALLLYMGPSVVTVWRDRIEQTHGGSPTRFRLEEIESIVLTREGDDLVLRFDWKDKPITLGVSPKVDMHDLTARLGDKLVVDVEHAQSREGA